jgi:hypothetical protein
MMSHDIIVIVIDLQEGRGSGAPALSSGPMPRAWGRGRKEGSV